MYEDGKPKRDEDRGPTPVNVNVNVPAQPAMAVIIHKQGGRGCLVSALYFIALGFWVGFLWTVIAWGAMVTILGIPLAIWMINRLPQVIALREPEPDIQIKVVGGATVIEVGGKKPQRPIWLRILYFPLGVVLSAPWMIIAYVLCLTILLMPAGFWMFDKTPTVLSLQRR